MREALSNLFYCACASGSASAYILCASSSTCTRLPEGVCVVSINSAGDRRDGLFDGILPHSFWSVPSFLDSHDVRVRVRWLSGQPPFTVRSFLEILCTDYADF